MATPNSGYLKFDTPSGEVISAQLLEALGEPGTDQERWMRNTLAYRLGGDQGRNTDTFVLIGTVENTLIESTNEFPPQGGAQSAVKEGLKQAARVPEIVGALELPENVKVAAQACMERLGIVPIMEDIN